MQLPDNPYSQPRSPALFVATGIFVIALGIIAQIGWILNVGAFTSVFANYTTMKFNTALCFVVLGMAFILLVKYNTAYLKNIFIILSVGLGLFALLSLSQNMFNYSAGIDELFVKDQKTIARHLTYPGRMATITSFSFVLMALGFLGINSAHDVYKRAGQAMLHVVSFISFIAATGFLLSIQFPDNLKFFSSMAVNTATGFLFVSVIASTINYNFGVTSLFTGLGVGNIIARRLFPRMLLTLIASGYISLVLERRHYISGEFGILISTTSFLSCSLLLIWDTLTEMNAIDLKRTEAEHETQQVNKNLEYMVKQRTVELEDSNERFRKIFNSNATCIAISRLDTGEYVDVNPALLELLGYAPEEILGQTASALSIVSAEFRAVVALNLNKDGFTKNEDIILYDKNKKERHCIMAAELLEYNGEKFMMSFIYDITNRKIIENNLQDTKKTLEVLTDKLTNQNKQLLSFAHIISHNLRSPVANLNLLMHFYNESTSDEDRQDLWGNFQTVVKHLNTTLDELLETLKIQEDVDKVREQLDFKKTFTGVHDILIGQIMESKAIIKTDFSKAPTVVYPKMYLESILLNLISNAIKYRSPDRIPHINIASQVGIDGKVVLTVKDNGLGIDLGRHGKNMFGMRKTFHRHAEAKGLGLFITKTQVETMGGEITVESEVNKGTMFKVIFNKKSI